MVALRVVLRARRRQAPVLCSAAHGANHGAGGGRKGGHRGRAEGEMKPWLHVAARSVVYTLTGCSATPPLISNLPDNIATAAKEFDHRIQERFPVGSLETDMVSELSRQGFMPSADRGDTPSKHVYSFKRTIFPARLSGTLFGRRTAIVP